MAINDESTLVIGAGNYFTADPDTEVPADLTAPEVDWDNIGHTSLQDIFGITSEGGEATNIGTLQNRSLRTKYSTRTDALSVILQQFDTPSLKLYYGSNAELLESGMVSVPENPTPTIAAFLGIFLDGSNVFAIWMPKAEIYRGDDIAAADTESLVSLPLSVKPKKSGTNKFTYAVTPLGDLVV